jgi:predicted CoA-substrate-specific enzyme activase
MMVVAGVDIGAVATKVAILSDGRVQAYHVLSTGVDGNAAANRALRRLLAENSLSADDVAYIVSTGYGRRVFGRANKTVTEITAHCEGARRLCPAARTVVDIGGQDSKAISIGEDGRVSNFIMNDKCAAGTGRFLEVMSRALHVKVSGMGDLALQSPSPAKINSTCTVFSESEVISLLTNRRSRQDIAAGLCESVAKRVSALVRYVGVRDAVVFSGGVAKNAGMVTALEKELQAKLVILPEPQVVGAVGAAYLAEGALLHKSEAPPVMPLPA